MWRQLRQLEHQPSAICSQWRVAGLEHEVLSFPQSIDLAGPRLSIRVSTIFHHGIRRAHCTAAGRSISSSMAHLSMSRMNRSSSAGLSTYSFW
jgi:hypothetical protein